MKVLVAAYACNPYKGSEEGVGWGWVNSLSKHHRLWVLTAHYQRTDLETAEKEHPERFKNLQFIYVPHKPWHYRLTPGWQYIEGSIFKPIMNMAYRLWQRDAFEVAKTLQKKVAFDLIHQITYVGFRFPGHLWKLNLPFVWGPIGGLENTLWRFFSATDVSGRLYYVGRNILNTLDKKYLPGPKKAFKKARGGIIAATSSIKHEIYRWYSEESTVICEIGPPSQMALDHSRREPGEALKLTWSGEHFPGKALPLLLDALSQIPSDMSWQLDILGEGPCTDKWRQLAKSLGTGQNCRWHGQLARVEALKQVHRSHLFIITSLKDLTSTVLLEALSQGIPVICPDHCGFADVVTDECGIKITLKTPRQFSFDLANAITMLSEDEEKRQTLAQGALGRIKDFSWEKKTSEINLIYKRMVKKGM